MRVAAARYTRTDGRDDEGQDPWRPARRRRNERSGPLRGCRGGVDRARGATLAPDATAHLGRSRRTGSPRRTGPAATTGDRGRPGAVDGPVGSAWDREDHAGARRRGEYGGAVRTGVRGLSWRRRSAA